MGEDDLLTTAKSVENTAKVRFLVISDLQPQECGSMKHFLTSANIQVHSSSSGRDCTDCMSGLGEDKGGCIVWRDLGNGREAGVDN